MGYYSTFNLSWESNNDCTDDSIAEAFKKLPYWEYGGFETYASEIYIPEAKWYDYHDDMFTLSKMFPEVLFHLWGDGENSDDLWEEHWKDGSYQHCHAEIPPYDPKKMRLYTPRRASTDMI